MIQRLYKWLQRVSENMANDQKIWKKGLPEEVGFWGNWFQTKGFAWPQEYADRVNPDFILLDCYARFINGIDKENIDILDVGAGPLTIVGKKHPTKKLNIIAIDPLANEYDQLLKKYNVSPPVRTIYGEAEKLDALFAPDSFDLVNATNCIDHSYDPLAAISQMIRVVQKNCVVFLSHQQNEGEQNAYQGLHQHNLIAVDGDFCVTNRYGQLTNITKALDALATFECQLIDNCLNVIITKK